MRRWRRCPARSLSSVASYQTTAISTNRQIFSPAGHTLRRSVPCRLPVSGGAAVGAPAKLAESAVTCGESKRTRRFGEQLLDAPVPFLVVPVVEMELSIPGIANHPPLVDQDEARP